jgi:hypothetical protein
MRLSLLLMHPDIALTGFDFTKRPVLINPKATK